MYKDWRNEALAMVEEDRVTSDYLLLCCLKYMSNDDVFDMLDCNELTERFNDDEEED